MQNNLKECQVCEGYKSSVIHEPCDSCQNYNNFKSINKKRKLTIPKIRRVIAEGFFFVGFKIMPRFKDANYLMDLNAKYCKIIIRNGDASELTESTKPV